MLTEAQIKTFCDDHNYDLRVSGNGRWIDQKCAADVVTVVADCILNYCQNHTRMIFSARDIWHDEYTVENVESIFTKPGVENASAVHEYDKFFQQPMEMLANSGVLQKEKRGKLNYYRVASPQVLEYIALRERNALVFLNTYIKKTLSDSGILYLFENFFTRQDKKSYNEMKEGFTNFIIKYTKINGAVECHRIFIKVLNPLAYFRHCNGTERGRMSEDIITYDMLMYNRNNFRDIYASKPKGVTRREFAESNHVVANEAYYHYQSAKAKKFLRQFNDQNRYGKTEHLDGVHINDPAIHMHHIFPESSYPEICYFIENIIALTPTQHLVYAHPRGNTSEIDEQYQYLLLLSKTERIRENLTSFTEDTIYDFTNLLLVLNVGFDEDNVLEIEEGDFGGVFNAINVHYGKIDSRKIYRHYNSELPMVAESRNDYGKCCDKNVE